MTWPQAEPTEMYGECDGCYADANLWQCDDDPGAWLYCYTCAAKRTGER